MVEQYIEDPITDNAVGFMRTERLRRNWSAQILADACAEFGELQNPPIPSTLSRPRISKLESGNAAHLKVGELFLLAGAFGVSPDIILVNGRRPIDWDALPSYTPESIGQRVGTLEERMREIQQTLGTLVGQLLPEQQINQGSSAT